MSTIQISHGNRSTYVTHGCRCADCQAANTTYQRARYRATHRPDGIWTPSVHASTCRQHLKSLAHQGLSLRCMSTMSGLSRNTLSTILQGRVTTVRPSTATAVFSMHRDLVTDGHLVDSTDTRVLLTALAEAGWTQREVTQKCGLAHYPRIRSPRVTAAVATAVRQTATSLGAVVHNGELLQAPPRR